MGDHVSRVDTGVVRQERVQTMAARDVQEAVGATLGHARDVGGHDGQEVQDIGHGRTVEVAVGLHPAIKGDDGVVHGSGELAARDQRGVVDRVARTAGDLRRAPQGVGILHSRAVLVVVAGPDRASGQDPSQVSGRCGLARVGAQFLQLGGEHVVGTEETFDAHRSREVGDLE